MGSRGRQSAAALALVRDTAALRVAAGRPKAPADLSPDEAREWHAIVSSRPAGYFAREVWGILISACQAKVSLDYLARVKRALHTKSLKQFDAAAYNQISNLQAREARTLRGALAELRRHAAKNVKKGRPAATPPWAEDEGEEEAD